MKTEPIALDTNVLVRFLAKDDPAQSPKAQKLIANHTVWVAPTVLLETEWVLRHAYQFDAAHIASFLRSFLGLPQVQVPDPKAIAEALRGYEAGLDFADALHLSLSGPAPLFATFDRAFIKKAATLKTRKVRLP